ncbi:hypothetical protein SAMN05444273_105384 [Litoreibacter ascidiaceicola]|uniref:Alpha/beta hydrolase n=1 Tax=Litoreibacter ascidiaceicola TaxID=1486859 RepID=A0A1M5B9K6_9RHOB|nr:hypothetical protein [Litoreibacter ascidiaceicola]SHF39203.1 hypothetical protein SAMN05444273_105384 [Litoreibacter ascidiaceicola]
MSDQKKLLEFTLLHDEHPLRIESALGESSRLIVSFTSVGTERDQWPPKEFVGLASQRGRNHVICITDISRSWMNSKGMANLIVTKISDYVLEHGITKVTAIGTSMGAYNALILGRKMPLSRIICFTPQYSVHPDVVPEETRWLWFRRRITSWPFKQMSKLPKPPVPIYMFHGDTPDEQMHWQRFPTAPNLKHYIFKGADHNFVGNLKGANTLRKIVAAAINNRPDRLGKVVLRAGGLRREDYADYALAEAHFKGRTKPKRPTSLGD